MARSTLLLALLGVVVVGAGLGSLGVFSASEDDASPAPAASGRGAGRSGEGLPGLAARPTAGEEDDAGNEPKAVEEPERLHIRVVDAQGQPAREMTVSFETGAWRTGKDGRRKWVRAQRESPSLIRETKNGTLSVSAAWIDEVLEIWNVECVKGSDAQEGKLAWPHHMLYFERPKGEVVLRMHEGRMLRVHLRDADGEPVDPWYPSFHRPDCVLCSVLRRGPDEALVKLTRAWPADPEPGVLPHLVAEFVPVRDVVLQLQGHEVAFRPMLELAVPDRAQDVYVTLPATRRVAVRVVDPQGDPVNVSVELSGVWSGHPWAGDSSPARGTIQIEGLPRAAPVVIGIDPHDLLDEPWMVPEPIEVPPQQARAEIVLRRGTPAELHVVGPSGEAVPKGRVHVERSDGAAWTWHGSIPIPAAAAGRVTLPGLRAGRYRASATPDAGLGLMGSETLEFAVPGAPVTFSCPAAEKAADPSPR